MSMNCEQKPSWRSWLARQSHNLKVVSSSLTEGILLHFLLHKKNNEICLLFLEVKSSVRWSWDTGRKLKIQFKFFLAIELFYLSDFCFSTTFPSDCLDFSRIVARTFYPAKTSVVLTLFFKMQFILPNGELCRVRSTVGADTLSGSSTQKFGCWTHSKN